MCSQLQRHSEQKPVDLRLSTVKPLGATRMVSLYDYLKSKPEIIWNAFKEAGIIDCLAAGTAINSLDHSINNKHNLIIIIKLKLGN